MGFSMGFAALGKYTKVQVLFFLIESILVLMTLSQCFALVASNDLFNHFQLGMCKSHL